MANLRIEIPKPCPASWSAMNPSTEGRHCRACDKTVVDFTVMSDEEIKNYLLSKKDIRVCGRFHTQQVVTSYNAWQLKLIQAYHYIDHRISYRTVKGATLLLITLVMAASGCKSPIDDTTGDVILLESDDTIKSCDSSQIEPSFMIGELAPRDSTIPHKERPAIETVKFSPQKINKE